MHMLYNSDSFTVVAFEIPVAAAAPAVPAAATPLAAGDPALPGGDVVVAAAATTRGGFEIVDKFARKGVFIEGPMAETFKAGAEALMAGKPSEEEIDDFIGRFTSLMPQPLVLH